MFLTLAIFLAFGWTGGQKPNTLFSKITAVTIHDLEKPRSRTETLAFFGSKNIVDSTQELASNQEIASDRATIWRENALRANRKKAHLKAPKFITMSFGNILFDGSLSKVTMLYADDSAFGAVVSIPYPLHFGSQATKEEYDRLSRNIAKEIGEPSIATANYIDYLSNGEQTLFGEYKDGKITITIWTTK
ncbi:MAG TPA: hypothetical protein VGM92_10565 [Candidatus Kapabacteria bacterium]|jgi:hypothetical protein